MGIEIEKGPAIHHRFFYGTVFVSASVCIMALFVGTLTAFGVFFKPVMNEFGWTRTTISGAFSFSWILQGLLAVIMGRLTDKFGPRFVMTLCGFFLGIGYIAMSQVASVRQFFLFYGLVGAGMSGLNVSLVSTVSRWFLKKRGLIAGIILAGGGVGSLITPPVAHWLISTYSWRQSYILVGGTVLIVGILAAQFLRRDPAQMGQLPYGHEMNPGIAFEGENKGYSLREASRTRQFWIIVSMLFSLGFCPYVIIVHIAPHATDLGFSASRAARILALMGALAIIGRIALGNAGDKIGNRRTFILSFTLMSISMLLFIFAREMRILYAAAFLLSFSWGAGALASPLVAECFGLKSLGTNLGVLNVGYSFGAAAGPLMAGYIFDVTESYRMAFFLTMLVALFACMATIFLKPRLEGS